ncbi:hypothetical protein PM082_005058 [Marasmius tenuissimus]|nr:hypothetical protein PM082_005058 [Marasmius tenuissimus]
MHRALHTYIEPYSMLRALALNTKARLVSNSTRLSSSNTSLYRQRRKLGQKVFRPRPSSQLNRTSLQETRLPGHGRLYLSLGDQLVNKTREPTIRTSSDFYTNGDQHGNNEVEIYPPYSKKTIKARLAELRDPTTDFKLLVHRRHYCDHTPIFRNVIYKHPTVLLVTPPGHGKTTILSMIHYFYDVLHKDEFHDLFQHTAVGRYISQEEGEIARRGECFVMTLDLAKLDVFDPDFDFDKALNKQLKQFLDVHADFFGSANLIDSRSRYKQSRESWWVGASKLHRIDARSRMSVTKGESFRLGRRLVFCIDEFDVPPRKIWRASLDGFPQDKHVEFDLQFLNFLRALSIWHNHGLPDMPLVMFAGQSGEIFLPPGLTHYPTSFKVHNLVDGYNFKGVNDMHGFNQEDIQSIADRLDNNFHSLAWVS